MLQQPKIGKGRESRRRISDYLPIEVWANILTKLPLKNLVQCTCVCKSWYCVITSSNFITHHLNHSITNIKYRNELLLFRHYSDADEKEHYRVYFDKQNLEEYNIKIERPSDAQFGFFRIVGSCNGLVCLSDDSDGNFGSIVLWNPSITKFVVLPKPRVVYESDDFHHYVLGFGFDARTNDYKVVRIAYSDHAYKTFKLGPSVHRSLGLPTDVQRWDAAPPQVEVYTLSSGSWRDTISYGPPYQIVEDLWTQAYLHGAVHWIAYDGPHMLILSFDLANEMFGEIELPEGVFDDDAIGVVNESLSILQDNFHTGFVSIWVMKEYGVTESWTNLYHFDLGELYVKVLGFRKNGEIIIGTNGEVASYNPKTKEKQVLRLTSTSLTNPEVDSFHVSTYMESLVLVTGEDRAWNGQFW